MKKESNNAEAIESMKFIRDLIDFNFEKQTQSYIKGKFWVFLMLFFIPFIWQQYEHDLLVPVLNVICLLVVVIMFVLEMSQMQYEYQESGTITTYFEQIVNWIELFFIFFYLMYFQTRI